MTFEGEIAGLLAEQRTRLYHRHLVEMFVGVEPDFDKWNAAAEYVPFDETYADAPINQKAIDEAEYQGGFWRAIWALLVGGKA